MRFWLYAGFFVLFGNTAVAAITPDKLRELAYIGDIAGVETALWQAHRESLTGDIAYDDLRERIIVLTETHPKMMDFRADWITNEPNSAYALTARAFLKVRMAYGMRGGGAGRKVHPSARAALRQLTQEAMTDAIVAFDLAPDFAPASDAVFVAQRVTRRLAPERVDAIALAVMYTTPNLSSLERIGALSNPAWDGEGIGFKFELCENYAHLLQGAKKMTLDECFVFLLAEEGRMHLAWDFANNVLDHSDHPESRYARMFRALVQRREDERHLIEAYFAEQTFERIGYLQSYIAATYFASFPMTKAQVDGLLEYRDRFLDGAEAQLVRDPFYAYALEAVNGDTDGIVIPTARKHPDDATLYLRRMAALRPWSASAWGDLAKAEPMSLQADQIFASDSACINYVVASGHSAHELKKFLQHQSTLYARFYSDTYRERKGMDGVVSEDVFKTVVVCRIARLFRLYEAALEYSTQAAPFGVPHLELQSTQDLRADIQNNNDCGTVWTDPVETLRFDTVDFTFDPLVLEDDEVRPVCQR